MPLISKILENANIIKNIPFLICTFIAFSIYGLDVDIISNFAVWQLPAQFPNIKKEFTVNLTSPATYLIKSATDPKLKKIILFNRVSTSELEILSGLPKEKLVLFIWEPDVLSPSYYEPFSQVYTWDDTLVDNVKFFRFENPYLMPCRKNSLPFDDRKLCTMVVNNWSKQRLNLVTHLTQAHRNILIKPV